MTTTARTMKKTMYVSEDLQEKIERLKHLLAAKGVRLHDHTGVVRDAVLYRHLVEEKLKELEQGGKK